MHIDEKWFYLSKESERYYLLREDREPWCTSTSIQLITKAMFLATVVRPRFDATRNQESYGKIGARNLPNGVVEMVGRLY